MEEISRGWADGPWSVEQLEEGATVWRRFALRQGAKIRMIDDYSASGINDACSTHSKLDLHVVDAFIAVAKRFFELSCAMNLSTVLLAKTYDLKSANRQVPIKTEHLKYAYFSVYNCKTQSVEIYRARALPFGATHSVYSFLRLARMLHSIATRCLGLMTTNFYDDFILASPTKLRASASRSMEMVFLLIGWNYARDGKKARIQRVVPWGGCATLRLE